jgi:hypothetical protein
LLPLATALRLRAVLPDTIFLWRKNNDLYDAFVRSFACYWQSFEKKLAKHQPSVR